MKMIWIHISEKTTESLNTVWDGLSDIESYPKNITFVKKVELMGPLEKGTKWYDTATALWFPFRVEHVIEEWEPKKKITYIVNLQGGGKMREDITLSREKNQTRVDITIGLHMGNPLLHLLVGPIFAKRMRVMMETTIARLHKLSKDGLLHSD